MSIVCRPQIVIPMMPGPPAQCRPAAPAGHHFASAQVSSRTRTSRLRVRLETCALAKNGGDVSCRGRDRGGPGRGRPRGRAAARPPRPAARVAGRSLSAVFNALRDQVGCMPFDRRGRVYQCDSVQRVSTECRQKLPSIHGDQVSMCNKFRRRWARRIEDSTPGRPIGRSALLQDDLHHG